MERSKKLREEYPEKIEKAKYQKRAIEIIIEYSDNGRPPPQNTLRENEQFGDLLEDAGYSSPHLFFSEVFESYTETSRAAKLRPNKNCVLGDYLEEFYELLDEKGAVPTTRELRKLGLGGLVQANFEEFERYNQIIEKVGHKPNLIKNSTSNNANYERTVSPKEEEIQEEIIRRHREGEIPDRFELADSFSVHSSVVERIITDIDWDEVY